MSRREEEKEINGGEAHVGQAEGRNKRWGEGRIIGDGQIDGGYYRVGHKYTCILADALFRSSPFRRPCAATAQRVMLQRAGFESWKLSQRWTLFHSQRLLFVVVFLSAVLAAAKASMMKDLTLATPPVNNDVLFSGKNV